jgi:hypothetical protein
MCYQQLIQSVIDLFAWWVSVEGGKSIGSPLSEWPAENVDQFEGPVRRFIKLKWKL